MKAILLAAGFGTRLRPLTETIPKCLVPIHGVPLLDIWINNLSNAGVNSFLINTHYLADQVEEHISKSPHKRKIKLTHENILLGTASTVIQNISFFEKTDGMVIHADNYCLADMAEFIAAHHNRPKECLMTMMTFIADNPKSCGVVELDESGVVIAFNEKPEFPKSNIANAASYIFSGELMELLEKEWPNIKDISTELIPKLQSKIFSYQCNAKMIDIGTIENYKKANST